MDDLQTGPVLASEAQAVVDQLQRLAERSAENHQASFHFVFALTAQSLSDNLEQVAEWAMDGDGDE